MWLSSSLGKDSNPGTPEAPVATFAQAIAMAGAGSGRVYACAEPFVEAVSLPAGVSLFGGFDCTDLQWRYLGLPTFTMLTAPADRVPLALTGGTIDEVSTVADLVITAADATVPGGSSIAALALETANALLLRSNLYSGRGAHGADGGDGDHVGQPAKKGIAGENGMSACSAAPGLGGEGGELDCGDSATSWGGKGGDAGELWANAGHDGWAVPESISQGLGLGGLGEEVAKGLACTPGIGGAAGKDGDHGWGAVGPGRLTSAGYVGGFGGDGSRGRPGQGGGGGGASAGNALCGAAPHGGAGGGAGGSGGCGGKGGRGGQGGGASIGLATLSTTVALREVSVFAGDGGHGGHGGALQPGGEGGFPGLGGAGWNGAGGAQQGCIGGGGGYGGDGGHGGGGRGGPSIAVATPPGWEVDQGSARLYYGAGGKGGFGGNPDHPNANGEAGVGAAATSLLP